MRRLFATVRPIRDELRRRVEALLAELPVTRSPMTWTIRSKEVGSTSRSFARALMTTCVGTSTSTYLPTSGTNSRCRRVFDGHGPSGSCVTVPSDCRAELAAASNHVVVAHLPEARDIASCLLVMVRWWQRQLWPKGDAPGRGH